MTTEKEGNNRYKKAPPVAIRAIFVGAASVATLSVLLVTAMGPAAFATPSPTGSPGQPGAPGTTCGSADATQTPGQSASANGSPFNSNGQAGAVYAGNPGTSSLANANSPHAVSQYDIACFQQTQK